MLTTKYFKPEDTDGLNEFLQTVVPASINPRENYVIVIYDDGAPINDIQRKNALLDQIIRKESKRMEAQVNVALSAESVKDIKDTLPKETKEGIRLAHTNYKDDLADEDRALKALRTLYESYGTKAS